MSKKDTDDARESEGSRPAARQCEVCKQWVSPGKDHLCRPDPADNE